VLDDGISAPAPRRSRRTVRVESSCGARASLSAGALTHRLDHDPHVDRDVRESDRSVARTARRAARCRSRRAGPGEGRARSSRAATAHTAYQGWNHGVTRFHTIITTIASCIASSNVRVRTSARTNVPTRTSTPAAHRMRYAIGAMPSGSVASHTRSTTERAVRPGSPPAARDRPAQRVEASPEHRHRGDGEPGDHDARDRGAGRRPANECPQLEREDRQCGELREHGEAGPAPRRRPRASTRQPTPQRRSRRRAGHRCAPAR